MHILIVKILVTITLILGLSHIAERTGPRVAGVLSGFPIGTALVLFFYGIELGPRFAASTVPYNLLGHVSAQSFAYLYFLRARSGAPSSVIHASLAALTGYALAASLMSSLEPSLLSSACISFASIALFSLLFRRAPNIPIERKVRCTRGMILMRLLLSTTIVLLVTGLAHSVGPRWAGLFSAFPLVVFPLVLLIHVHHGHSQARTVLKNFPRGLWTVLAYSVTVSFTYGHLGVYLGTAVGYMVAAGVMLAVNHRVLFGGTPAKAS
ncbi:MAG: hypothetical protein JSV00_01960 [bacterium]|nr:MAG: hypothetical protein JSV00_01960 [bacterium]